MTDPVEPTPDEAVSQLLSEAQALDDLEHAMPLYQRALELDPQHASTHYNIGLVYKYRSAWPESLHHSRRAAELCPDDEAALWNMGIAATALRDWAAAREAWRHAGIEIAGTEGPIEDNFGITPVRLHPDGAAEVVWGRRIDPVRVVIENIPSAATGYRAGDVVLHDGAPAGEREHNGRTYPVFDVLALFEPSPRSTFEAVVHTRDAVDLQALTAAFDVAGVDHEVWTSNLRLLCRACSLGLPHEHAENEPTPTGWPDHHRIGISSTNPEAARLVLARWSGQAVALQTDAGARPAGDRVLRFACVLDASAVH